MLLKWGHLLHPAHRTLNHSARKTAPLLSPTQTCGELTVSSSYLLFFPNLRNTLELKHSQRTQLVTQTIVDGIGQLVVMNADGSIQRQITQIPADTPDFAF